MMKKWLFPVAALFLMPAFLDAAPASVYGKALQRARGVAGQAEKSRTLPPEPARKPVPPPAAPKPAPDRMGLSRDFSSAVFKAKLKRYPVSGVAGVNELLNKKIILPHHLGIAPGQSVSEKTLPFAWFGAEANRVRGKGVFPLFITKPAFGPVTVGFTDGKVIQLKERPLTVTGVIHILRSTAKNKKSSLWTIYQTAAGKIDRASK